MSKRNTVDQHYVPRCYLENFGTVYEKGNKKKILTSFFQFSEKYGFFKENVPTKSICYKRYYYDEDNSIEKMFAAREKNWSILLRKLSNVESYVLDTKKSLLSQN